MWTNLQNIKESKTKFLNFPKSQPSSLSQKGKRGKVNPHIKEKKPWFLKTILSIATTFLFSSPAWKLLRKKKGENTTKRKLMCTQLHRMKALQTSGNSTYLSVLQNLLSHQKTGRKGDDKLSLEQENHGARIARILWSGTGSV